MSTPEATSFLRRARVLRRGLALLSIAAAAVLLPTAKAHAYLDPGTGSIIVQGVIGGIAAALVVVKVYWQKVKGLFVSQSPSAPSEAAPKPAGRPTERPR